MANILKIAQFNIQSLKHKKTLLNNFLLEYSIHICLLNETWLKDGKSIPLLRGYNLEYINSANSHNGVGILIKDNIKYNIIPTQFYEDIQNIAITVDTSDGKISILCVYCPPSSHRFDIKNKIDF